ncbi:hypothetical protein [Dehalobacter restrictus]|uniref:Uncharacterized protein n=1 Tax=Dehalobacter restrictus TaxID=55583 RepID=A0A857DFZ0_9FIRM|nr:hypothetical protein [Dehalobacter restrictus]QGZ99421.1 hypothetical protein GQ588_01445 [Dehalobacter restrictus]
MYLKKTLKRINQYVIANYKKIDNDKFIMGDINYTYKCHLNAVQSVKLGRADKVFACIAIDKNDSNSIVIHFINQLFDGKYQDNTWGWLYEFYDYYLIREVDESEYGDIGEILNSVRETLVKSNSSGLLRKLCRVKLSII